MSEEHKRKIAASHLACGESHWTKRPEVMAKMRKTWKEKCANGYQNPSKGKKRPQISGSNHYLWNGKTPLAEQIRKCIEYRQWRSDIFTRDDFTCQQCGMRGGRLHADHIKQFAFILSENNISSLDEAIECSELWNLNNGRTLCKDCHRQIPAYSYDGTRKITFIKGEPIIY